MGLDDDANKRLIYAEETEDIFDRETETDLERLSEKVSEMKNVSSAIEIEIEESMHHVNAMVSSFLIQKFGMNVKNEK